MKPGSLVLDLGCGTGRDTGEILQAGFSVIAMDGSAEMAGEAAKRTGLKVHVGLFEEMEWEAEFDAIWANASLLHVPRPAMVNVLKRTYGALRNGRQLYASFKTGPKEGRDELGRYYNYPNRSDMEQWMQNAASWSDIRIEESQGSGYDKKPTAWLHLYAIR